MTQAEIANRLRQRLEACINVIESEELKALFVFAHAHDWRWNGPTVDTEEMKTFLAETKHPDGDAKD
ncbi:MAG: hypothetical protein OXF01_07720 [Gemmatimonadetes bacterium]|nr:hypothetical protein [Gemmatimonadota bacterium]